METFPFKKVIIALVVIMAIVAGVGLYLGANESTTTPGSASGIEEVRYNIVEIEDISFTTVVRKSVRISTNAGVTQEEIEWIAQDVVSNITKQQPVNAIAVAMYHYGDDYYDAARVMVNWAPYGDWSRAIDVTTGDYQHHQYSYNYSNIQDLILGYTPPPPPPTTTPMTASEQSYRITVENRTAIYDQAINVLSELMANLQIGDAPWTVNVAVQLSLIRAVYNEAIAIDPPSSMAHIHEKYVQAMEHYNTATQQISQGIEEQDVNLIEQATIELFTGTGTQLLSEAIELLNEFILAHSP